MISIVEPKAPGEEIKIEFPFATLLGAGVTISNPVRSIVCVDNDPLRTTLVPQPDLNASAMQVGGAAVVQDKSVFQEYIGGVHGVDYKASITVDTSDGGKLTVPAVFSVRNK